MDWGICTQAANVAKVLDAKIEFVEEHVQNFLMPEKSDADFAKTLEIVKASPLPVPASNCFLPATLKCTGPMIDTPRLLKYADTAFARAKLVGMSIIVFGSGGARQIPDGFAKTTAQQQFIDLLKQMGPIAKKHDVTIVVEPLNRGECNFVNTLIEGADITRAVGHPNVRLLADLFHMLRNEEDPDDILKVGDLLAHTHVAERETRSAPGVKGDNFRPFLKNLKKVGYDKRMAIEVGGWVKDIQSDSPAAVAELKKQWSEA